ncbi:MAG: hypothetical protein ACRERS_09430, partial [Methylococcales bacterium]
HDHYFQSSSFRQSLPRQGLPGDCRTRKSAKRLEKLEENPGSRQMDLSLLPPWHWIPGSRRVWRP